MSNLFFTTKLSFFNYVYSVCDKIGLEYDDVRDMVVSDSRIGRSHDKVSKTMPRGWGSYCFPKDILAFLNYSKDVLKLDPELLQSVWNQNLKDRGEADWEKLGPAIMSYKYKKDDNK